MSLTALFVLCRFAHFASLMQIFGLSVFCSLLAPAGFSAMLLRKNQTLMMWSGAVAAVTSVGMLSIQAMLMGTHQHGLNRQHPDRRYHRNRARPHHQRLVFSQ